MFQRKSDPLLPALIPFAFDVYFGKSEIRCEHYIIHVWERKSILSLSTHYLQTHRCSSCYSPHSTIEHQDKELELNGRKERHWVISNSWVWQSSHRPCTQTASNKTHPSRTHHLYEDSRTASRIPKASGKYRVHFAVSRGSLLLSLLRGWLPTPTESFSVWADMSIVLRTNLLRSLYAENLGLWKGFLLWWSETVKARVPTLSNLCRRPTRTEFHNLQKMKWWFIREMQQNFEFQFSIYWVQTKNSPVIAMRY